MENLKPQDVLVVLKLSALASASSRHAVKQPRPPMAALGIELGISSSEVHAAIRRARASGLLRDDFSATDKRHTKQKQTSAKVGVTDPASRVRARTVRQERINVTGLVEFLVHGLK